LLGEDRVIAFDEPGTTRDSIYIDLERNGKKYSIIDTAGMRRRGKIDEAIEKFSVIKTLQSIEDANVVVLVLDARQEISNQDAHIGSFILESGRALVLAVNKWDSLELNQREAIKRGIARKLNFLAFANCHYISALQRQGMDELFKSIDEAYTAAMVKLSTPKLTRALLAATMKQEPPRAGKIRPKLRYAHQGGVNPPVVIVHGNALSEIPDSYWRYLESSFREAFRLKGTPLQIQFKKGSNPYADRDN
jgi:GTP-binding protein